MKRFLWVVLTGLFLLPVVYSQSESDALVYRNGIRLLEKSQTSDDFIQSASYFAEISDQNSDHWLACYYTAFSYIMAAKNSKDKKGADEILDKAQQYIDRSFKIKPAEPENYILQAFVHQIRLSVNPQGRAISLSQKAEISLNKAIEADSNNPRAYFLMANNIYHTPPIFKGGPKNALPVFLKAREKYRTYKPKLSFSPVWGADQNEEMIRLCTTEKG